MLDAASKLNPGLKMCVCQNKNLAWKICSLCRMLISLLENTRKNVVKVKKLWEVFRRWVDKISGGRGLKNSAPEHPRFYANVILMLSSYYVYNALYISLFVSLPMINSLYPPKSI